MAGRRSGARRRNAGSGTGRREPRVLDAKAARLAAADLLSRRAWTQSELTRRLVRRGAPPDIAADVVADMVGRGYVNDAEFARHFVETRAARGYGAARLTADLLARGVSATLVVAAIADLDAPVQLERARAMAQRRLPVVRRGDPSKAALRLRDYLLRRGFAAGVVMRVVRECLGIDA